jgi:hypothetical protein
MFESDNASRNVITSRDLYCVWICATETPGAPLIAVWIDIKMRAFETEEGGGGGAATGCRIVEESEAFNGQGIKHGI